MKNYIKISLLSLFLGIFCANTHCMKKIQTGYSPLDDIDIHMSLTKHMEPTELINYINFRRILLISKKLPSIKDKVEKRNLKIQLIKIQENNELKEIKKPKSLGSFYQIYRITKEDLSWINNKEYLLTIAFRTENIHGRTSVVEIEIIGLGEKGRTIIKEIRDKFVSQTQIDADKFINYIRNVCHESKGSVIYRKSRNITQSKVEKHDATLFIGKTIRCINIIKLYDSTE